MTNYLRCIGMVMLLTSLQEAYGLGKTSADQLANLSDETQVLLKDVLIKLGTKHKRNIIFSDEIIKGLRVQADTDTRSGFEHTLALFLKGHKLTFKKIGSSTYIIIRSDENSMRADRTESERDPSIHTMLASGSNSQQGQSIVFHDKQMVRAETFKGVVTDENGNEVPGVSVIIKETNSGTLTDLHGRFSIYSDLKQPTLVFSYVGFTTYEHMVTGSGEIKVVLKPAVNALEELVVIGYGTQKKSDLTGSVSSVKGDQIHAQSVRNPVQALSGLAAGVQVMQNSGEPGSALSVRIRGGNSILGGNEPLYVIDGLPITGSLDNLNTNDIQSMEILKDASATAIYGSRGANGVVLITTKRGKGKTLVEYNNYVGIQSVTKKIDMLNAREFAQLANIRAANDKEAPFFTEAEVNAFGKGTDWQDEIFRNAAIQNHTLSISGSNDKTRFNISGSYFDQQGIIINSFYKQFQLRSNIDHNITKNLKVGFNNIISRRSNNNLFSENSERGAGVLSGALIAPPTLGVRGKAGEYSNIRKYPFSPDIAENPVAMAMERKNKSTTSSLLSNLYFELRLLKDFTLRSSFGAQYAVGRTDFYSPTIFQPTATGSASISYGESLNLVNENTITYNKTLGKDHNVTALAGLITEQNTSQSVGASATGFLTNILENNSLQSGSAPGIPTSGNNDYSILSTLGRINYGYKGKYLLTGSIRADGSSRFGNANKWGYFPSAAAAWKVSEESFWEPLKNTINEFKLRSSWGITGNTAVSPYQSLFVLSNVTAVFNDNLNIGFAPGSIQPNPQLKWETTRQFDIGFDLSLLKNRLQFTFDYYKKNTNDLLNSVPVSPSTGYSTTVKNLGKVQNNGFELAVNAALIEGPFTWNLGVNASRNRNKVVALNGGADVFGVTLGNTLPAMSLVREGYPIGVFYGYLESGYDDLGNITYKDLDNNGTINGLDRTIIGDPNPGMILGLNSTMNYKNFSLNFLLTAITGQDVLNYNLSNVADGFSFGINQMRDVLDNYWTPTHTHAKYPKISKTTRYLGSDRFIENGAYLRLKNIQLAYTVSHMKNDWFNGSQVYVAAQNLFTVTKYSFYTPEVNTRGASISKGIDQFGYPDARTLMIGLRLKF